MDFSSACGSIFSFLSGLNGVINSIRSSACQRLPIVFHGALDGFFKIIFVIVLIEAFGSSGTVVIVAYCLSLFIVIISQILILNQKPNA